MIGLRRHIRVSVVIGGFAFVGASPASAAHPYPQKPVRVIVNVTAGGGIDTTARFLAQHLNNVWKQPFVVDNRTGAGGSIGIEIVARAPPDGYTLLVCSSGIVTNAAVRPENYDPVRDLQAISNLRASLYVLVVSAAGPARSVKDLLDMARARPGMVSYATTGVGSITHLGSELLTMLSGTKMMSIPYKGVGDGYPAVATGDVTWMLGSTVSALPLVKLGRLRALAITSGKRNPSLPDLPTVAESGVPGYEFTGWVGLFAPAGTPGPLVERLSIEARVALQNPDFVRRMDVEGSEVIASTSRQLSDTVKRELQLWRDVVKNARIDTNSGPR